MRDDKKSIKIFPEHQAGIIPPDPVAPDSLKGIPRVQTRPSRWTGQSWKGFVNFLHDNDIIVREDRPTCSLYVTDGGGIAYGMPRGVVGATSTEQISVIMKAAQKFRVPVKTRGGALTTEGESVSFGGLQLDMTGMSRILSIDEDALTVRTQAGIYWHSLAEALRRKNLDYLSAPLNLTSTVGGTLSVGGIDINSPRLGCSADQAISLQVVMPTGEIMECSESHDAELFDRVLFGYGQFGIITEATLRIRPFTPISMHYFYYKSLRASIEDLIMLIRADAADYIGILTIMDRAINLLVAFDSEERKRTFFSKWRSSIKGHGELSFGLKMAALYAMHPWKTKEALYLLGRKRALMPEFNPGHHMRDGRIVDRTVVFSKAVWKFWGGRQMVIPDLATSEDKFVEAVERGNAVCKKYFRNYTLYCVGIKLMGSKRRYEMSCIPPDANGFAYGCEFEPMLEGEIYGNDYLQSFKNEIYDIGVDMKTSYYRFGGMMKGYIRRVFGNNLVDRHLAIKREIDPAMILNSDVIF
ncbi:MAG: FAD-binding oxidoreductase [Deltaproteobacteria bacterium]|nr:FAD-binding oxidoreductase [Deltaproteobacteria bacterium]